MPREATGRRRPTGDAVNPVRGAARWVRLVWRQPDQYEWVTIFLRERALLPSAQRILATVAGSAAFVPLTILLGQGRTGVGLIIVECAGCVLTILMAGTWMRRWPSRRQSQIAAVTGLACVAGWSLAEPNPALAAAVCTAAAITGGYFAFLHSGKLMILNLAIALLLVLLTTWRLLHSSSAGTAISAFWLVWFVNLSVPLTVWAMALAIRLYATRSTHDPLTGLLNRRAFFDALTALMTDPDLATSRIVVAMIDLDNFKALNDNHGYGVGDRILTSVAEILRDHAEPETVICRAGGEEFLIAAADPQEDAEAMADKLCAAIARLSPPVTASIGTATASGNEGASAALIDELIRVADAAMYAAKRLGATAPITRSCRNSELRLRADGRAHPGRFAWCRNKRQLSVSEILMRWPPDRRCTSWNFIRLSKGSHAEG